ncbi:MAG: hypothetical protein EP343_03045 [Deltaproteobacteria bacterium]|nr:MAG: hypothetical protein EP343_03045 [Deltaproteobacteria bacterium]
MKRDRLFRWKPLVALALFLGFSFQAVVACSGPEQTGSDAGSESPLPDAQSLDDLTAGHDGLLREGTGGVEVEPIKISDKAECENLNPRYCPLPWPSMRYLTKNEKTETGFHIDYDPKALVRNADGEYLDPTPYKRLDGFSTNTQVATLFAEPVDVSELAGVDSIDRSLKKESNTLLVDLEKGELVAHWVENDARADSPKETLFFLRPSVRLMHNRRYAVVLRNLKGKSGATLEPTDAFRAFRDNLPTNSPQLEARRASFEALFTKLASMGVERKSILSAWQFHTSSFNSNHADMFAMRDDAVKRLGAEGIGCKVDKVEEDVKKTGARVVVGTIKVPFYMTADKMPAEIARDKDGKPSWQKDRDVKFTAVVPKSLLDNPTASPLITLGHGLFGEAEGTLKNEAIIKAADAFKVIWVGVDWDGMSRKDLTFLATALGNPSKFYMVGEMLRQAMINQIALTRTVLGKCRGMKEFKKDDKELIDPKQAFFIGVSQGAILGGTLLSLSPDIKRGALLVGGTHFSFMIERSIHFNDFELFLIPSFPKRIDRGALMALSQHVWDRAESGNYIPHLTKGLNGYGPKEFLYIIAENDAQVPNLSSDLGARLAGIPVLDQSVRKPWGIKEVKAPYKGSAYISYHWGDPDNPVGNVSPKKDNGGHWNIPINQMVGESILHFFQTGEAIVKCKGPCDLKKQ